MKKNIGLTDGLARIVVGCGLLGLALLADTWWGYLGAIPLITGAVGNCPIYSMLGISTDCSRCVDNEETA